MLLHSLLSGLSFQLGSPSIPELEIHGVQEDSRLVRAGDLFVARGGTKTDGRRFVDDAVAHGALAVVTESRIDGLPIPQIIVADAAATASVLANRFHGNPSDAVKVLGVTGTNGKTTVTYLIRHILAKAGHRCGMIGTVEIDDGRSTRESTMTTPGAIEVAQLLASMKDKGCRACAIETSSHALAQQRVTGVTFAAGAFTNLTGDHLDYHKTMDAYAEAKSKLFENLPDTSVAILNDDDPAADSMVKKSIARVVRFGFGRTADYRARDVVVTATGTNFTLHTPDGQGEIAMQLVGKHNVANALTAAAVVGEVFGLSVHQIAAGLRDATGAPGRLQAVRAGQPFAVLVDYAHTDDALENVLQALRPLARGKLRVLFGCGGDRDRTKRPRMARTATSLADAVYVTSDNPRTENPQAILDEILSGVSADSTDRVTVEIDRRRAIEKILADSSAEDVVLIAGKGHENYQIIGTTKHHFDDVEEATRAIKSRLVTTEN